MTARRISVLSVPLLALLVLLSVRAWAQVSVTATITGFVTDPSGAFVPGATVTVVHTQTALTRTVESSAEGSYTFPGLRIGSYDLTVSKAGFRAYKQSGITLQVNQTARVDVALTLGEVGQTVEVTAQATLLQTQTSSTGQVVEERRLSDLPLKGRNPIGLLSLVAGATVVSAPEFLGGFRSGSTASVNGSRGTENNYLFDGNNYAASYFNTGLNYPNPDALAEFKLITHNYSAEFGRNVGSVMTAVTRSGSNEFHGTLWDFLRNDKLNARNFFARSVPVQKRNQFGLTAGGPIKKDKLFVFGSYQGFRGAQQASVVNQRFATAKERAGDFSAFLPRIVKDPLTGQPFPGNIIPSDRLSPIATKWYNTYVPFPNNPDGTTFTAVASAPQTTNQYLVKLDYHIKSNNILSGRWFWEKNKFIQPLGTSIPNYNLKAFEVKTHDVSLTDTWTISPTLLNQAHFGINRVPFDNGLDPSALGFGAPPSVLGIKMPDMRPYAPNFSFGTGYTGAGIGSEWEGGFSHQYSDTLTWVHNKHTFRFGMELMFDTYHNRSFFRTNGAYTFDGSATGNGLADFLLGKTSEVRHNAAYYVDTTSRKLYPFVQDDWKVTPRLTLNLGFRWELNQPFVDYDRASTFKNQQGTFVQGQQSKLFPAAPTGAVFPGDPGVAAGLYPLPKGNVQPRLGFAWDPRGTGRWVIRAGIGLFAGSPIAHQVGQTHADQPFLLSTQLFAPAGGLADPYRDFPGGNPWPFVFDQKNPTFRTPVLVQGYNVDNIDPRIGQWNFSVQRAIGANWLFDIAYVGSVGHHLTRGVQANPARYIPGNDPVTGLPLSTTGNVNSRRVILPGVLASVFMVGSIGNSSFHSLQYTVQKRMSRGLMFLSSYTWSHSLDNVSSFPGGPTCQDPFNCSLEKGNADFDRRHVYALSFVYDVPKPQTNNRAGNYLLGNWGLAGVFNAATGAPFTVATGLSRTLTGDGGDRPNVVGDPLAGVDRSTRASQITRWFNPSAFVANPIGTPGNAARNFLFGPGGWNFDFSVLRDFPISEKYGRFQFRAELFNVFNNAWLGSVDANIQSGRVGTLNSAGAAREIQFGLKYIW